MNALFFVLFSVFSGLMVISSYHPCILFFDWFSLLVTGLFLQIKLL